MSTYDMNMQKDERMNENECENISKYDLIHNHPLIFSYLLKDRFTDYVAFPWILEILAVLGTALIINIICYAIDFLRFKLSKWLHIRKTLDVFEERMKKICKQIIFSILILFPVKVSFSYKCILISNFQQIEK